MSERDREGRDPSLQKYRGRSFRETGRLDNF